MEIKEPTYQLCGYIQYLKEYSGFVTPVFIGETDNYFIQVISDGRLEVGWEVLPVEYETAIVAIQGKNQVNYIDFPIYGFSSDDGVFFANAQEMSLYLIASHSNNVTNTTISEFIQEFSINTDQLSKEEVWAKCLGILSQSSKALPKIFKQDFQVVSFDNGVLSLKSENDVMIRVFKTQFESYLIGHFRADIPSFDIQIIENDKVPTRSQLESLPHVFYGGGDMVPVQGSYLLKTRINEFQNFDNFIVGNFNELAFLKAMRFVKGDSSSIILVNGAAGLGKTHLVNSIAKSFNEIDSNKQIGFYTIAPPIQGSVPPNLDVQHFERVASSNDIIIIDDAHNFDKSIILTLVRLLKGWSNQGKKIAISLNANQLSSDLMNELLDSSDHLLMNSPSKEDKLKIIKTKTSNLDLNLTIQDITSLSSKIDVNNIADIESNLMYLYFDYNSPNYGKYWIDFASKSRRQVDWYVCEHFDVDSNYYFANPNDPTVLRLKVISEFVNHLLLSSGQDKHIDNWHYNYESHRSLNAIQHYLFKDANFRYSIKEILLAVISNWRYKF